MKWMRILPAIILYYLTINTSYGQSADTTKIIFIGSSIIGYYHSVPDILDSLAVAGDTVLISGDASLTGYTFKKHLNNPATINKIAVGDWDYAYLACWGGVIDDTEDEYIYPWLQMLCDSLYKYNRDIKIILSMNHIMDSDVFYAGASGYDDPYWDDFYRSVLNKNVEGYKSIADIHNIMLDPFALVWDEIYIRKLPGINLYGLDEVHLNAYGAYMMASDIYSFVFKTSPKELQYTYNLDSDTCQALREATEKIVLESPEEWGIVSGISEVNFSENPVHIYPNPASSYIVLDKDITESIRFELINYSTGQIVCSQNIMAGMEKRISLAGVPGGFYIIRIISGTRIRYSKLLISR